MNCNNTSTVQFGKVRSILWPIYAYELKKFLPMFLMFFFISFNYSIMRNIKDSILINASIAGSAILPYIKFWGVTPIAILMVVAYSKLTNKVSSQTSFYLCILFFTLFFAIFALFLYPNDALLHPARLEIAYLPTGLTEIFRLWSFSLQYIFAELWGSVALSLLFWQFANQTTRITESKRFYPLFGIGANLALEASGQAIGFFDRFQKAHAFTPEQGMSFSLNNLTVMFCLASLCTMVVYWWMNKYVLSDARFYDPAERLKQKSKKLKMTLGESVKMLLKSNYLICIALLVICYGISINLIEVTWKDFLRMQYPSPSEYLAFMGVYSRCTAWTTICMMLFVAGNVLRKFGWTIAALVTPVVLLLFGIGFFNLLIFEENFQPLLNAFGISALALSVFFGTIQNVVSKASKYSLFDPTKEMLYIPLDDEAKTKGKAAIDVVGARLGKAGGSIIQQFLFFFGSLSSLLPCIEMIFVVIMVIWIGSVLKLSKSFSKKDPQYAQSKQTCSSTA